MITPTSSCCVSKVILYSNTGGLRRQNWCSYSSFSWRHRNTSDFTKFFSLYGIYFYSTMNQSWVNNQLPSAGSDGKVKLGLCDKASPYASHVTCSVHFLNCVLPEERSKIQAGFPTVWAAPLQVWAQPCPDWSPELRPVAPPNWHCPYPYLDISALGKISNSCAD